MFSSEFAELHISTIQGQRFHYHEEDCCWHLNTNEDVWVADIPMVGRDCLPSFEVYSKMESNACWEGHCIPSLFSFFSFRCFGNMVVDADTINT